MPPTSGPQGRAVPEATGWAYLLGPNDVCGGTGGLTKAALTRTRIRGNIVTVVAVLTAVAFSALLDALWSFLVALPLFWAMWSSRSHVGGAKHSLRQKPNGAYYPCYVCHARRPDPLTGDTRGRVP